MNQNKITIMLVDDMPANLTLLREMLQCKGYRILAFPRGAMALRAALENPPDLILLDINMPDMDGYDLCRRLKAEESLKEIPVLFISGRDDVADKVKAFAVGGVDYVTKPFQVDEVNARVETHLRLRWMQRELTLHNLHLEDLVREKVQDISDSQLATILAVSKLAEHRDDDTGKHIERTRNFCRMLAEKLRDYPAYAEEISDDFIHNIYHASPLHDIGKVGISDSILLKPGKLTPEEFDTIKTHTVIGADTLQAVHEQYPRNGFVVMGIALTRSHHEKWDGSGYPDRLAGADTPLCARIMAIADVYDALRSERPYKAPFSNEKSVAIISEGSGKHFDPTVFEAFMALEEQFRDLRA